MKVTSEQLTTLAGSTLADKYRLTALLGQGGMGVVYQAEQIGLGRSVAVKLLRRDLIATRFEWFRAEAMAASRINHPHAVAIYDFGVTRGGDPYLVMEHLRGQTLSNLIETEPLSVDRIVRIGGQILSALAEAHACGVIHCDLTGDNVIVERLRAGDDFAKVIDFGLARLFDASRGDGRIVGTAEYMAPEQIRGELVHPATDIYAIGVLLYEMIVGRTPFAGGTVPVILQGHLGAQPVPPNQIVANCPPLLAELVLAALEKQPEKRPPSAGVLRERLLALSSDPRVTTSPLARPPLDRATIAMGSHSAARMSAALRTPPRRSTRLTCDLTNAGDDLAGREVELARLVGFCRSETPGVFNITGGAGVGKASLLTGLRRELGPRQRCFVAASDPSGLKTSWYPILGLLEEVLELKAPFAYDALAKAVSRAGLPDRDVPGLAELFAIDSPFKNLELAVRRREAQAAALRTLVAVQRRHPRAVLGFVDVDAYDHPSAQLVAQLVKSCPLFGLHLVTTSRKPLGFGGETLELGGLAPAAARTVLERSARRGTLPDDCTIRELTGGMPEAIEQLGGWIARGNLVAELPSLLVDLMSVRINRLEVESRRVLQAVAIHGSVAPRWLVEASLSAEEAAVLGQVDWAGLLVVSPEELTIPSPLVASVVWASTPADVRRRLHYRAFEALGEDGPAPTRAHHAEHAGELRSAYDLYLRAGHEAAKRFDDPGAAVWYGRAVAMARELAARGLREANDALIDSSLLLGEILRLCGEHGLAVGALDEAALGTLSDRQRAISERVRGLIAHAAGDRAKALGHLQQSVGAALRAGERNILCQSYIDLADVLERSGELGRAIDELEQAIDVCTMGDGLKTATPPDRLWRVGKALAEKYLAAGQLGRAKDIATQSFAHARRLGWVHAQGRLSALLAHICEAGGEHGPALRHRANAIEDMRKLGDRRSTAELLIESAQAVRRRKRPESEPAAAWLANPDETLRLAQRLAAEIGWDEGIELSEIRADEP